MALDATTFFNSTLEAAQKQASALTGQLRLMGGLRALTFVLSGLTAFGLLGMDGPLRWGVALVLLVAFGWAVKRSRDLDAERRYARASAQLCEAELASASGDHSFWDDGSAHRIPGHAYAADLDLLGPFSIYRMLNRAMLSEGRKNLAKRLMEWESNHQVIQEQQAATRRLSKELALCHGLVTDAFLSAEHAPDTANLRAWAKQGNAFTLKGIFKVLPYAIPLWAVAVILLSSLGVIGTGLSTILILAPLGFVGAHLAKTTRVSAQLDRNHESLAALASLFDRMAQLPQDAPVLAELRQSSEGAGKAMRSLSGAVNGFNNRNNLLVAVVFNMLAGWDFWCLLRLERWHAAHGPSLSSWLDAVAEMEVITSLALYTSAQSGVIWPELSTDAPVSATGLAHPMIAAPKRVANDFELQNGHFSIVTGANMAGKSTFLRTLGVNLVLAQAGAPVVATTFRFRSIPLFSSMRAEDNLAQEASYFYAELHRLQQIITSLEAGNTHLVILDEILKGTNSKDKAEGSRKFLEKLTGLPALGVIATHDLSLCEVAGTYPQINNKYFDVTIGADDLDFDYVLRDGVCSNMNATFLMDKMGITR